MEDLREFQKQQIEALQAENAKLKEQLNEYLPKEFQFKVNKNDPAFHKPISEISYGA